MAVVVVVNAVSDKNDVVLDRPLRPLLAAVRLLFSLLFIDGDDMVADLYNSVSGCGVIPSSCSPTAEVR